MHWNVCGVELSPPSFRDIADHASRAVYTAFQRARIIELHEYVSSKLQETARKVQQAFESSKDLLLLVGMSTVAALVDPAPFFSAMVVGALGHLVIDYTHGTSMVATSFFLKRAYELFIAQTALVSVHLGCAAVRTMNFQFFPPMVREASVSSILGGLMAGAALAAGVQRMHMLATRRGESEAVALGTSSLSNCCSALEKNNHSSIALEAN